MIRKVPANRGTAPKAPDDPTWIGDLPGATFTRHFERRKGGLEQMLENITGTVERAVDTALEGVERGLGGQNSRGRASRILTVRVESSQGDEYTGNFPLSLAPHLHKLIPPYGLRALEQAGAGHGLSRPRGGNPRPAPSAGTGDWPDRPRSSGAGG